MPIKLRAARSGRGQQLPWRQFQASAPDRLALLVEPAHTSMSRPAEARAHARSTTQACPPTSSGRIRDGRATPTRRATGTAVRPDRATVATITRNVTGRIFEAPPTCLAASCAENVGAVAAATIPRGAITFPPGQVGPEGGQECHQRPVDQHQDGHQPKRRQHQIAQRRGVTVAEMDTDNTG